MSAEVAGGRIALLAHVYWRAARNSRHQVNEVAMFAQANLWGLVTAPDGIERIRQLADRHLRVIAEHPVPGDTRNGRWEAVV